MPSDHPTKQSAPGARDVFALAWPMTVKAIFLHGTIVIDGYLVSSLGETSLAAMGLAAAIGGMVLGVIFAFSHAMQIRTAQASGAVIGSICPRPGSYKCAFCIPGMPGSAGLRIDKLALTV